MTKRWLGRVRKMIALVALMCSIAPLKAKAQPKQPAPRPTQETFDAMFTVVSGLVGATQSDSGYLAGRKITRGSSDDLRLALAWKQWRRFALYDEQGREDVRLILKKLEVTEYQPLQLEGGPARYGGTAQCKVFIDVASVMPEMPVGDWPAEPWQSTIRLWRDNRPEAVWRVLGTDRPLPMIDILKRGGDRLQQAIEVLCKPAAMLRTGDVQKNQVSLQRLAEAVERYVQKTGKYPPFTYRDALLNQEPSEGKASLRQAFKVAGTNRYWVINPLIADTSIDPLSNKAEIPLFWDGRPHLPYFLYDRRAMIGCADGAVKFLTVDQLG